MPWGLRYSEVSRGYARSDSSPNGLGHVAECLDDFKASSLFGVSHSFPSARVILFVVCLDFRVDVASKQN